MFLGIYSTFVKVYTVQLETIFTGGLLETGYVLQQCIEQCVEFDQHEMNSTTTLFSSFRKCCKREAIYREESLKLY